MAITAASKGTKQSIEWATPKSFYDALNLHFDFTLDPCATAQNAKCRTFFTKEDDGLSQSWAGHRVFMNPPYGRELAQWVEKAYHEAMNGAEVVVCLVPPRTETVWFQTHVNQAEELWLIAGRLHFENPDNPADRPQDPSCVVVLRGPADVVRHPVLHFWHWQENIFS